MILGCSLRQMLEKTSARKKKHRRLRKSGGRRKRSKVVPPVKDQVVPVDYTSLLPEHVLHHILSYCGTKDAARASVLSKRWRQARDSSHIVEFDQTFFEGLSVGVFRKYVDDFFQRRLEHKCDIQTFRLVLESSHSDLTSDIARWLQVAVQNSVKEIDLHVQCTKKYNMPSFVLAAKTLTAITLHRCKFGVLNGLNLPNLKKLHLKKITLTANTLKKLTSSCPSIESLALISCKGLEKLEISTLEKLNILDVHYCKGIRKVEIMAPNLESFRFYRFNDPRKSIINLVGCSSLKKFYLQDPSMHDLTFDSLILNFPCLEKLVLSKCHCLVNIKIFLPQLKSLVFKGCENLVGGEFHVPQLVSFEYSGGLCNTLFSLFNSSSLRQAKLHFRFDSDNLNATQNPYVTKIYQFLSRIDQSSGLKLVVRHKKKIAVYQKWNHFKLGELLPDMMFEIIKPSMELEKLLDYLIQIYQPKTLSLVAEPEWHKILSEKVINQVNQKDELSCCPYFSKKCWRHYLKGVTIEHSTPTASVYDDLNTKIMLVEEEELPLTTISLVWETQTAK